MEWDEEELPSGLEAALQAADAEFERRNGGSGGSGSGKQRATTAAPEGAAQAQQPAAQAVEQALAQQGAPPPALEAVPAQVAVPHSRRRRQLPSSLQGAPPPSRTGSRAAGHGNAGNVAAATPDENLPTAAFPGRVHYAFMAPEVDRLCQWVLESGIKTVGFDIEARRACIGGAGWLMASAGECRRSRRVPASRGSALATRGMRPLWLIFSQWWVTYQTGVTPRKVALIQLCYLPPVPRPGQAGQAPAPEQQHVCLLLHVAHSGIPPHLQRLLGSEAVLKVGVGAHGDALKVCRDFGFEMQGVLCLSECANARLVSPASHGAPAARPAEATAAEDAADAVAAPGSVSSSVASWPQLLSAPHKWSLAALVSHLLALRLEKSQGLRCSNWEVRPPLSSMQMHYAATDAWASLRCHEILAKLPVLVPAPAPGPAASSTLGGPAQLAAAATAEEGAAAADGWVPACLELRHLQPAKLAVYQAVQQQGLSVGQVAAQRRIQEDSVQGYMAEAISAGMGYCWDRLGVPPAALQHVAGVCSELLGRQLTWRPGPPRPHEQGQEQGEQGDGQQPPQAVGSKRPPPCSPSNLAVAVAQPGCECATAANQGAQSTQAAAADGNGSSISAGNEHAQPPAQRSQPMDILELLLAAGHKLRELKEERFEEVSYGQLRLVLAHLGRLNPGPWDS